MQAPYFTTGQKPEIGVRLSGKYQHILKRFKCSVCGKVVFEYYNDLEIILPDAVKPWQTPIVIQCHGTTITDFGKSVRCKALYFVTSKD